jgi:hypothetical protein
MFFGGRKQVSGDKLLAKYAATVEQMLSKVGVDPVEARLNTVEGFGWNFRRGSAVIEVYVSQQGNRGFFQVLAPIVHIPPSNLLPLYRHLLELNLQLTNASIGVYLDVVYVFNERPLEGLDPVEADNIIKLVAGYADELDNQIADEFGARLYSQV